MEGRLYAILYRIHEHPQSLVSARVLWRLRDNLDLGGVKSYLNFCPHRRLVSLTSMSFKDLLFIIYYYLFSNKRTNKKQKANRKPGQAKRPSHPSSLICLTHLLWFLGTLLCFSLDSQYLPPPSCVLMTPFRQAPLASIADALSWARCHEHSPALWGSTWWRPPTPGQAN